MNSRWFTLGDKLQIRFDEKGMPRYSARGMSLAEVEKELVEYQEFIERWLERIESQRTPSKPSPDEETLSKLLKSAAKDLKRGGFEKEFIVMMLEQSALALRSRLSSLTEQQTSAIVAEAVSTL